MIDQQRKKEAMEKMAEHYAICENMDSTEARIRRAYLDGGREIWIVARTEGRADGLDIAVQVLVNSKDPAVKGLIGKLKSLQAKEQLKIETMITHMVRK